ncbi:DHH family phosphoesterase [Natronomonas salina]|uniref:DHH family phosphoesterase n=1 Tax=Natronomonas salina TaxID=1710540 RepID=UPI0015B46BAD|nr:DHH family phosphoesterase [Natronomonas salina]QLD88424.1 DHH family phosphoesterase [Natronomonas salina]
MDRLVLGCGTIGLSLVERLAGRPGSLLVLVDDEHRVASLREEGVDARDVDVTDGAAIRAVAGDADSVVVAPDGSDRARELARVARETYPGAFVLACLGYDATEAHRTAVAEYADRTVDVAGESAAYLDERAGDRGIRTRKLQSVLRNLEGTLAVVAHDNPDPDAIASAVGLQRVAEAAGTEAEVCYYGEISHQENRALVNLLEYDLRNLSPGEDLSSFAGFALVDHSRPGINDGLPRETPIDVVIDHHPPRAPVEARFVDLRSDVGATSTLVTGYLDQLGVEPAADLATGLLYGILTDTQGFSREVSRPDFEAAARLVEHVDSGAIERIESPSVTAETLDIVAGAIGNRRIEDDVLTTGVGAISDRDALAQAADRLLEMEGVDTTLVFGYTDDVVYVSARSRGTELDLGEALRDAFGQIGSAGGHADMAGAQIPVGILVEETDEADRESVIEEIVTERFFETLGIELDRAAAMVYGDFLGTDGALD